MGSTLAMVNSRAEQQAPTSKIPQTVYILPCREIPVTAHDDSGLIRWNTAGYLHSPDTKASLMEDRTEKIVQTELGTLLTMLGMTLRVPVLAVTFAKLKVPAIKRCVKRCL